MKKVGEDHVYFHKLWEGNVEIKYESLDKGIDLHIHSTYSDGTETPETIINMAIEQGLRVISITDHATTRAYSNMEDKTNLIIIPGIEITSMHKGKKIHLLGYGAGVHSEKFQSRLVSIQKLWNLRFYDMLDAYNIDSNCKIAKEELENIDKDTIDSDSLCRAILQNHPQMSIKEIKDTFFSQDKKESLYIPCSERYVPDTIELLIFMCQCNIKVVLAHTTVKEILELPFEFDQLKKEGLYGLEVFHPKFSRKESQELLQFCKENKLQVFGGSDFHGSKKLNKMGQAIKDSPSKVPFWVYTTSFLFNERMVRSYCRDLAIEQLTLEEKVALILKPGFDFYGGNGEFANMPYYRIEKSNIYSLKNLTYILKEMYWNCAIPLLVNVNQEGGKLNTIDWDWKYLFPGNYCIGRIKSPGLIKEIVSLKAKQLRSLGITWNLAPVADVNVPFGNIVLQGRCFGNEWKIVAEKVFFYIEQLQKNGVAATAKHFPGIGKVRNDPHAKCPIIDKIEREDLEPFIQAIRANVAFIMVSNIIVKSIDPEKPACMSKKIIEELLINRLGYNGIIVTENINTNAMQYLPIEKIALECFLAGADMIMFDPDFSRGETNEYKKSEFMRKQQKIYNEILEAVKKGVISTERLNFSIKKILNVYNQYGIKDADEIDYARYLKYREQSVDVLEKCAYESVYLLYKKKDIDIIVKEARLAIVQLWKPGIFKADSTFNTPFSYEDLSKIFELNIHIFKEKNKNINIEKYKKYDLIIYVSYNSHLFPEDRFFLENILANRPVIILGIGEATELMYIKRQNCLAYISVGCFTYFQIKRAFELIISM